MKKQIPILVVEGVDGNTFKALTSSKMIGDTSEISRVNDAETAIKYLNKELPFSNAKTPNLIFIDLKISNSSVVELLTHIKENAKLIVIPVILLSSPSNEKDLLQFYNHHANCIIAKPVKFEKFLERINIVIDFWINIAQLPKVKDE